MLQLIVAVPIPSSTSNAAEPLLESRLIRSIALGVFMACAGALSAQTPIRAADTFTIPAWAFPTTTPSGKTAKPPQDTIELLHVPNSTQALTILHVRDRLNPPDWFPSSHPAAPDVVIHARPEAKYACGLCHLPDGQGRSENATIAGLPLEYFLRQIADIKSGARVSAVHDWAPMTGMRVVSTNITDEEALAAARYFGALRARARYRVVESVRVPATYEAGSLLAARPGTDSESLDGRLLEISNDIERHELRDPNETFTTFVPSGSISRGRHIASSAPAKNVTRCANCHGPTLRGVGIVPPLAGRSPAYILRQLIGFRTGARNAPASAPMQLVASKLTIDEMVAVAAYAGSRPP